jgi:integral membrane protein
MLKIFRTIAVVEGISYLLLFAFSMPLKYWAGIREPNQYIGYAHGFLFIAYIALAILIWKERAWNLRRLFYLLLASLLPFGTFYLDKRLLSRL